MKNPKESSYLFRKLITCIMQWKLDFDVSIPFETKREILKKHWIKKEPFSKVSIHQMYITEVTEHYIDSGMKIFLDTKEKIIKFSM